MDRRSLLLSLLGLSVAGGAAMINQPAQALSAPQPVDVDATAADAPAINANDAQWQGRGRKVGHAHAPGLRRKSKWKVKRGSHRKRYW